MAVATVATQATNARVGAHAPACVGAHAGSALHARYRGARTRGETRAAQKWQLHFLQLPLETDPATPGVRYSQRLISRNRGAAQFMRMK